MKADQTAKEQRAYRRIAFAIFRNLFGWQSVRGSLLKFCIYIPTALLAVYLFVFHSNMYVSESSFALRLGDAMEAESKGVAAVTGMVYDTLMVYSHITSADMLEKVSQRVDLRKHYADKSKDIYSRLKAEPTREEMLKYWRWIVSANFEMEKGFISLEVKAYTPEMAKAVNDAILASSEELVNQINARSHSDALKLAKEEVRTAEDRVLQTSEILRKFRDDKSMLDPKMAARSLEAVLGTLETDAANTQAELTAAQRVMQDDSPKVRSLQTRLGALKKQLESEKNRLAGLSHQTPALSSVMGDFGRLTIEEQFANERLARAMAAFESARIRAVAQSRYIVPFEPPTLPEESTYPRPFLFTLFGFFTLLTLLGICSLIVAAVRDHMEV